MSWTNLYRQIPAMAKLGYLIKWKLSHLVLKILQRSLHQSPVAFFAEVLPLAVRLPRLWGVCSPGSCSLAVHLGDSRKERQLGDPPAISKRNHEKTKGTTKNVPCFRITATWTLHYNFFRPCEGNLNPWGDNGSNGSTTSTFLRSRLIIVSSLWRFHN